VNILTKLNGHGSNCNDLVGTVDSMAWDTEGTKRRLRDAAAAEFAEHGLHGTTVERIAARASVNKERIYKYFDDKSTLFAHVMGEEVEKVAAAVPLTVERTTDFGELAGRTFDYQQDNPDLARLVIWEGLADAASSDRGAASDESDADADRREHYASKVAEVAAAQRAGLIDDAVEPEYLVFLLMALASWWDAAPQIARLLSGRDGADPDERGRRRAAVVEAAHRLATPSPPRTPQTGERKNA
jgi:AcrR family transcriptional regulator